MKSSLRTVLMASAISTISLNIAFADEMTSSGSYYVGGGVMGNVVNDNDIEGSGFSSEADISNGTGGLITFGYDYDSPWRGELELGLRKNNVDSIGGVNTGGKATVYTGMANALYDVELDSNWTPYLGVGAGLAYGKAKIDGNVNGSSVNENDKALAVQFIAGASYDLSYNWQLVGQYNLLTTPDKFEYKTAAGSNVDYRYTAQSIMVGVRYTFGEPPAPMAVAEPVVAAAPAVVEPAPAPAPVPEPVKIVRSFLVFFDWDSDVLTPEALDILAAAADNAKKGSVVKIDLTGHADTSGTQNYNMKLSNSRAMAVKAELVRLGLISDDIMATAKGELEPLVSTGDSVREPQNRRVEIMFD